MSSFKFNKSGTIIDESGSWGHDVITYSTSPISQDEITFCFKNDCTWWKGIKVFDSNGKMVCLLSAQDDDHSIKSEGPYPTSQFAKDFKFEFWKAGFVGIHICGYSKDIDAESAKGKKITIEWTKDRD